MKLSLRDFFIEAWILYILFVVISTETLSVFNIVNSASVLICHALFIVGILIYLKKNRDVVTVPKITLHPNFNTIIVFLSILTILIPLAFIAIYYPPNNWDSMTYHMSRVMHWIQNQNIAFYPTNNERQLYLGPTSEYIILNWILIFGVDALSNFIQYFSMIGSVITSTLIGKLFSKDKLNQLIAGILTLTIPMGIMQSTTTQNDYLTAFFLISFIYFGLLMVKKKSTTELKLDFFFLATSFALGAFTKNTFLIFSFPFCVYILYQLFKTYKFNIIKYAFALLTLCLMVNLPQWIRNMEHFGTPIGPAQTIQVLGNDSINLNNTVSNLIRNSAMNLGLPNDYYNNFVDNSVSNLQKILGITPNDPRNSFLSIKYKTLSLIHEDVAGNFLILILLIIVCFIVYLKEKSKSSKLYLSCVLGGWLLFSVFLKWQPWNIRLQMPLFVISTPILALVIKKYVKKPLSIYIFLSILIVLSWPWVAGNMIIDWNNILTLSGSGRQISLGVLRHKIDREKNYYNMNRGLYEQHKMISSVIKETGETNIALDIAGDSYEYPLWVLLKTDNSMTNLRYIRQSKKDKSKNFNKEFTYKIVIYDDLDTENFYSNDEISKKVDLGNIRYLILKNESKKLLYI